MRYGVIGPRDFRGEVYDNKEYISGVLATFDDMTTMISGGSRGVEAIAESWCNTDLIEKVLIPPNIKLHGNKEAFNVRNAEIIENSDILIVFWDGTASGIVGTLAQAMIRGVEVYMFPLR